MLLLSRLFSTEKYYSYKVLTIFKVRALFVILFLIPITSFAQYSVSGENDSKIEYRQIKTDKFHIVYPNYYEKNAQLLASILDTVVPVIGKSLNVSAPRVPILIHSKSATSNGLSVWAPKRMEFWTTTPPSSYAYPFLWQLALHEYRHTAQMQALNVGVTHTLSKIFGEHIIGAIAGIWLPNWFLEGDAVVAETALAPAGRGQDPDYNMFLKAQILDKGRYEIDKMLLGSMRDFVPDYYNLGYFLVSYGRAAYSTDIWGDCLNYIGSSWWKLASFGQTASRNNLNFKNMYNSAIDSLEKVWADNDIIFMREHAYLPSKKWGEKYQQQYVNYRNPIQIDDTTVLALKTSDFNVQYLVKIVGDKEEKLLSLPYLMHSYFDYLNGNILYAQYSPNIRWGQEANADIVQYNIETQETTTITKNTTCFTPVYNQFNQQDSIIATIVTDSLDNQTLNIIYPKTQKQERYGIFSKNKSSFIETIASKEGVTFSYPAWMDNENVFVIETSIDGKTIAKYNIKTGVRELVLPYSYDNMRYLKVYNNRLFFVKDIKNKYQLVSINLNDYSDIKIHSNARFGIDSYYVYDSTIVLSHYTSDGYRIVSTPYREENLNLQETSKSMYFTTTNRKQENFILNYSTIDTNKHFASERYYKFTHLFNIHSWAPVFINAQARELGWGASIMSQNLLSTSVMSLGFKYNFHDKNELYFDYTYSGLYPIFKTNLTFRPRDIRKDLDSNKVNYINWDEVSVSLNTSLPFTWTSRNFYNNLTLSLYHSIHSINNNDIKNPIRLTLFNSLAYEIKVSNYSAMAENDLYPRFGHRTNIRYEHTLTSNYSNIFSFNSQIFFPGFATNHSFNITLSTQKNTPNIYYFPNQVNFVRGVYDMYPKWFYGFLSTYALPLAYPDSGISGIFYIKRITVIPFYNLGSYDSEWFQSYGLQTLSKVHFFRITIPVEIGFQLGYCPSTENTFASFLFNIDV